MTVTVRAMFVVLVVAALSASAEEFAPETTVVDATLLHQAVAKTAAAAHPTLGEGIGAKAKFNPALQQLMAENEKEEKKIADLKKSEAKSAAMNDAEGDEDKKMKQAQLDAEETGAHLDATRARVASLQLKKDAAGESQKLMEEIMDSSEAHNQKVKELNAKLEKAAGRQALEGAADALKAQQSHLQAATNIVIEKTGELNNLKKCATCPGHAEKIAIMSEEVTQARTAVDTAKADMQKIKVVGKASIESSAQNNVRIISNQMAEAKKRLGYLEKKSIKQLQIVAAKGNGASITSSNDDAVATAAAKSEVQNAAATSVKAGEKVNKKQDALLASIQKYTARRETEVANEMVVKAKVAGDKVVGEVQTRANTEASMLADRKRETDAETNSLKSLALQAAATGNLEQLASVQGKTAKAVSQLEVLEKRSNEDKKAIQVAQEHSLTTQLDAKAKADAVVSKEADEAVSMAHDMSTPMIESRILIGQASIVSGNTEAARYLGLLVTDLKATGTVVSAAQNATSQVEEAARKAIADKKLTEFNTAQEAPGSQSEKASRIASLEAELRNANDAVKVAAAKSGAIYTAVSGIVEQACMPGAPVVSLAQQMISVMTSVVSDANKLTAQKEMLGISEMDVTGLQLQSTAMSTKKAETTELTQKLASAQAVEADAKKSVGLAQFAQELRPAEAEVFWAQGKLDEADRELNAAQRMKKDVDLSAAKNDAHRWQKEEMIRIGGPSIEVLQKKKTKIDNQIKAQQVADEEEKKTTNNMNTATKSEDLALKDQLSILMKIQELEQKLKQMPKLVNGVEPAERIDALEEIEKLEQQKEKADVDVKKAKLATKAADIYTPIIEAEQTTITSEQSKLRGFESQIAQAQEGINDNTIQLKRDDLSAAQRETVDQAQQDATTQMVSLKGAQKLAMQKIEDAKAKMLRAQGQQKRAIEDIKKRKSEALDANNAFVRNSVQYAMQEKAEKTVGAEAAEKHLAQLKNANVEKAEKNEVLIKKEKLVESQKIEVEKELTQKKVASYEEKTAKGKEKIIKQKVVSDEKSNKEKIDQQVKAQREEESLFKTTQKAADEKREKDSVAAEQRALEKVNADMHAMEVAKENKDKKIAAAASAQKREVDARRSSDLVKTNKIAKIDADIRSKQGTSAHSHAVAARADLVKQVDGKEEGVKTTYVAATKKAVKEETAANTEYAQGQELLSKANSEETKSKTAVTFAQEERAQKVAKMAADAMTAHQTVAAAKAKEAENKNILEQLSVTEDQDKRDLIMHTTALANAKAKLDETTRNLDANTKAYTTFSAVRAGHAEQTALKQLAEAEKDLSEDQNQLPTITDPKSRAVLESQIVAEQKAVARQQDLVTRDGKAVSDEVDVKKRASEDQLMTRNAVKEAELAHDKDLSTVEKDQKSQKGFQQATEEMENKKEAAEKAVANSKITEDTAKEKTATATNEISYKNAKATESEVMQKSAELGEKEKMTAGILKLHGVKSEANAKAGLVKLASANAELKKSAIKLKAATFAEAQEMSQKQESRKAAAATRFLSEAQFSEESVTKCQGESEKAIKAIAGTKSEAEFSTKTNDEQNMKAECKKLKDTAEISNKEGGKEIVRKKEDISAQKLMKENEQKYLNAKQVYDIAKNKEADILDTKRAAGFAAQDAEATAGLASEKATKVDKNLPANVANSEITVPKQADALPPITPAESGPATSTPAVDATLKVAANFTSPYIALTEDIKRAEIPSVASRRRAVTAAPKNPTPAQAETEAAEATEPSVTEAKTAVASGFTAHYWKNVADVENVADAIKKISKLQPTKSEVVSEINFKPTEEFWPGLDDSYNKNFVARFRGHLNVPASGIYTFYSESDDGSIVYVNGKQVVVNDGVKDDMVSTSGNVHLEAGKADIVVDYFSGSEGMSALVVEWSGDGIAKSPITAQHVVQMNSGSEELLQIEEGEVVMLDH